MPTPVITNTQLGWAYQTSFVNRIKTPSSFLTQLVFGGRSEALPTESVELSYRDGERLLAPMVEVNAEAVPVGSRSTTFANVSCPNIRIKRPMEAYQVFLRRQPGTGMFIDGGGAVSAARQQAIADDATFMVEMVENRLEWMVSQLLTDTTNAGFMRMEYQVEDRANWAVNVPRSTDMEIALAGGVDWDSGSQNIQGDIHGVKRLFSKHINSPLSTAVMGSEAATAFMADSTVQTLLDRRNVNAGVMELQTQFNESGAIYLGSMMGVNFWEYSREYVNDSGSAQAFIPAQTVVYLAGGSAFTDSKVLYGAIPDHGAFDAGLFVGQRFSKSWKEEDPSTMVQLLQTRPLPHIRQPNAVVVMDVLA